jgi:hypothetical protein
MSGMAGTGLSLAFRVDQFFLGRDADGVGDVVGAEFGVESVDDEFDGVDREVAADADFGAGKAAVEVGEDLRFALREGGGAVEVVILAVGGDGDLDAFGTAESLLSFIFFVSISTTGLLPLDASPFMEFAVLCSAVPSPQ